MCPVGDSDQVPVPDMRVVVCTSHMWLLDGCVTMFLTSHYRPLQDDFHDYVNMYLVISQYTGDM